MGTPTTEKCERDEQCFLRGMGDLERSHIESSGGRALAVECCLMLGDNLRCDAVYSQGRDPQLQAAVNVTRDVYNL